MDAGGEVGPCFAHCRGHCQSINICFRVLDTVKKHLTDPDTITVSALETEGDELKRFLLVRMS